MQGARIGENCKIFPGAVVSAIPQDLKFEGEESLAIIGDNTTIRECATINRGTSVTGKTIAENHKNVIFPKDQDVVYSCNNRVLNCSNNKTIYWCGDHPCINKKEKEAYFKETMIVEVRDLKK